jgi:hypothetical protein
LWGLILILAQPVAAESATPSSRSVLALDVFNTDLDFDTTLDIGGPTRFFSSRHNLYAGGRLMVHNGGKPDDTIFLGSFGGFFWGKTRFMMNWEEPGLLSFDPLDTSLGTMGFVFGKDLNLRVGTFLTVAPYASAKGMWMHLNIEIGDEDFSGNAFKLGFDVGVKVTARLGSLNLAAGAGLTHILNDEIEFEVDDLTFDSKTSGSAPQYFLGVEL